MLKSLLVPRAQVLISSSLSLEGQLSLHPHLACAPAWAFNLSVSLFTHLGDSDGDSTTLEG